MHLSTATYCTEAQLLPIFLNSPLRGYSLCIIQDTFFKRKSCFFLIWKETGLVHFFVLFNDTFLWVTKCSDTLRAVKNKGDRLPWTDCLGQIRWKSTFYFSMRSQTLLTCFQNTESIRSPLLSMSALPANKLISQPDATGCCCSFISQVLPHSSSVLFYSSCTSIKPR